MMQEMIMRVLLSAIVFSMAIVATSLVATAIGADKTCLLGDRQEFFDSVKTLNPKIYRATPKALATILGKINAPRLAAKSYALDADELYLGIFTTKEGTVMAGIVMFKDGCIVPGTVTSMNIEQWAAFMEIIGLKREDFYDLKEATS
jgi:hypothetical protein